LQRLGADALSTIENGSSERTIDPAVKYALAATKIAFTPWWIKRAPIRGQPIRATTSIVSASPCVQRHGRCCACVTAVRAIP
jgi:hypothetical protein